VINQPLNQPNIPATTVVNHTNQPTKTKQNEIKSSMKTSLLLFLAIFASFNAFGQTIAQSHTPTPVPITTGQMQQTNASLYQQVVSLQIAASNLQKQLTTLEAANAAQAAIITSLQSTQKTVNTIAANPVLQLGSYVYLDMGAENFVTGPNIVFHGANVHVVSGSGVTADSNSGLGNLIVGYCEPGLYAGMRHGSHNLVIGSGNSFTSYGGFVAGVNNVVESPGSSCLGGNFNVISGPYSVCIGGIQNTAGGQESVVGGGFNLRTTGFQSTLLDGYSYSDPGTQYFVGFRPDMSH
jgi:hypothetical protein